MWGLIVSVPDHCLHFTLKSKQVDRPDQMQFPFQNYYVKYVINSKTSTILF